MIATDFHTHVFPPGMVPEPIHRARAISRAIRLGRDQGPYVDKLVERMMANVDDPGGDLLRADLEEAGIRRAALHGLDWGLVSGDITEMTPEGELEWAREIAERHQGFFLVFYGIDPRRSNAVALVKQALADGRLGGIKLYPPAGFAPSDDRCLPIYQAVVDAGAVIMFHTGRQTFPFDLAHGRLEAYGEVQRRFPTLRLVLGHAGYPSWGREAVDVAAGHPSTWVEISSWHLDARTDPCRVRWFLGYAWSRLGPGRVLFGTDFHSGPRIRGSDTVKFWKEFVEETAAAEGVDLAVTESSADQLFTRV